MKKKIIYLISLFMIGCGLAYLFKSNYIHLIDRIINMFSNKRIDNVVDNSNYLSSLFESFSDKVSLIWNSICSVFSSWDSFWSSLGLFLKKTFKWILMAILLIVYFIQIIVIIRIVLNIYFCGENKSYKTSRLSKLLIFVIEKVKSFLHNLKVFVHCFVSNYKLQIVGYLFILFICSGYGLILIFEFCIYIYLYFKSLISFTSHVFLFDLFKLFVSLFFSFIKSNSFFENFIIVLVLLLLFSISCGKKKLLSNKNRRMAFVSCETGVLNLITGKPSSGKSMGITIFSLDAEELFIQELEENLLQFESEFPSFNLAMIHLQCRLLFGLVSDEELEDIKNHYPNILNDLDDIYYCLYDVFNADDGILDIFYRLFVRGCMINSSSGIIEPFYGEEDELNYSHAVDFDSLRWYSKEMKLYHEPYEVMTLYEIDKEFNSHDSKGEVSDDGTAAFFAMLSHICKRHVKVFADYQSKDQLIKRIRDVSEIIIRIDSKKYTYPFLIRLIRKPFVWIDNGLHKLISLYRINKKPCEKKSLRFKPFTIKRNDVGLIYLIIKYLTNLFDRIYQYFDNYLYIVFRCVYTWDDDFSHGESFKYAINVSELSFKGSKIYESCQYLNFFKEIKHKKNQDDIGLASIPYWDNLSPGFEFYNKNVHQHFNDKLLKAQFNCDDSSTSDGGDFNFYG